MPVVKLVPLLNNDHCCLFLPSSFQKKHQFQYKFKRSFTKGVKLGLGKRLAGQAWDSVLNASDVDDEVLALHTTINRILDELCPLKKIRVRDDDPSWENKLTRKLRSCKNQAYKKGCLSYHYFAAALRTNICKNKRLQVKVQLIT